MTQRRIVILTLNIYFHFQLLTLAQTYEIQNLPTIWEAVDSLKEKNQFLKAAHCYEAVTQNGLHDPFIHIETARLFTRAQKPEKAFYHLEQAVLHGFSNKDYLLQDRILTKLSIQQKEQWNQLVSKMDTVMVKRSSPEKVNIVTSDLPLFYQAYHKVLQDTTKADSIFYHKYIVKGSVGLHSIYSDNIWNIDRLSRTVLIHEKKFYSSIEKIVLASDFISESDIKSALKKIKVLYEEATFPDIYITMGIHKTGAKESAAGPGLIVCAEFFTKSNQVDISELTPFHKAAWYPSRQLTWITLHELCHSLQKHTIPSTLLDYAIIEGSCDFIASIVLEEDPGFLPYHAYGEQHEVALWKEFKKEMHLKNVENWLWNNAFEGQEMNSPADLGYYVGYKICESYYNQADDKKAAIKEILNIKNFYQFLQQSKYDIN